MKHTYSRRKYQESVKYLKGAVSNPALSHAFRRRCVELLVMIYEGVDLSGSTKRDARAVKDLVVERADEKRIQAEVRAAVLTKVTADAEREAKAFLDKFREEKETENGIDGIDE